jgi:hypothetical protein
MYAFLCVLGAVAVATGFALIASGVPLHESAHGNALIISGTVAAIGGFIIVGLGLAVRELQRIERAMAVRPMPRPQRPGEATAAAPVIAVAAAPAPVLAPPADAPAARIPFPTRPKAENRPQAEPSVNSAPATAGTEEAAFERLRQKFPSLARIENAPVVEATEVSLSPKTPARTEEDTVDARNAPAPAPNEGAEQPRGSPYLDSAARPAPPPQRPSRTAMFDAFWPKDSRRGKQAAAEQAAAADVAPPAAVQPAQVQVHAQAHAQVLTNGAAHELNGQPQGDIQQVSILKSGVVDGMAYTLYSDGSIEAQLPQGTVRFGSITELRNHLEKNS